MVMGRCMNSVRIVGHSVELFYPVAEFDRVRFGPNERRDQMMVSVMEDGGVFALHCI